MTRSLIHNNHPASKNKAGGWITRLLRGTRPLKAVMSTHITEFQGWHLDPRVNLIKHVRFFSCLNNWWLTDSKSASVTQELNYQKCPPLQDKSPGHTWRQQHGKRTLKKNGVLATLLITNRTPQKAVCQTAANNLTSNSWTSQTVVDLLLQSCFSMMHFIVNGFIFLPDLMGCFPDASFIGVLHENPLWSGRC